jgi:hypothetical protein
MTRIGECRDESRLGIRLDRETLPFDSANWGGRRPRPQFRDLTANCVSCPGNVKPEEDQTVSVGSPSQRSLDDGQQLVHVREVIAAAGQRDDRRRRRPWLRMDCRRRNGVHAEQPMRWPAVERCRRSARFVSQSSARERSSSQEVALNVKRRRRNSGRFAFDALRHPFRLVLLDHPVRVSRSVACRQSRT